MASAIVTVKMDKNRHRHGGMQAFVVGSTLAKHKCFIFIESVIYKKRRGSERVLKSVHIIIIVNRNNNSCWMVLYPGKTDGTHSYHCDDIIL